MKSITYLFRFINSKLAHCCAALLLLFVAQIPVAIAVDYSLESVPITAMERKIIDLHFRVHSSSWVDRFRDAEQEPIVLIYGVESQADHADLVALITQALRSGSQNDLMELMYEHGLVYSRDDSEAYSTPAELAIRFIRDNSPGVSLRVATELGDVDAVRQFFEEGTIGINDRIHFQHALYFFENEYTALMLATFNNKPNIMKYLLESGADPKIIDSQTGTSPMNFALRHEGMESVQLLLEAGADVNELVGTVWKEPPLVRVARNGRSDLVSLLVEYGANPNVQDDEGMTPLMSAIASLNQEIVEILLPVSDPRLLTYDELSSWSHSQGTYDYLPITNALALARIAGIDNISVLESAIYARAMELDKDWGAATVELGVALADSYSAYHESDVALGAKKLGDSLKKFNLASLDDKVPEYLLYLITNALTTKHELDVINGQNLSESDLSLVKHLAERENTQSKWHDMLNIFAETFANGPSQALQEKWLLDYGEPDGRWKFNRLETWANSIDDEQKARDVVNAIGFFNRQ